MEIYTFDAIVEKHCPKCSSYYVTNNRLPYSFYYKIKSHEHWANPILINDYELVENYKSDIVIVKCNVCGYERVCYCKDYNPVEEEEKAKEQAERAELLRKEKIKIAKGLAL
jgi:hypothetical protein